MPPATCVSLPDSPRFTPSPPPRDKDPKGEEMPEQKDGNELSTLCSTLRVFLDTKTQKITKEDAEQNAEEDTDKIEEEADENDKEDTDKDDEEDDEEDATKDEEDAEDKECAAKETTSKRDGKLSASARLTKRLMQDDEEDATKDEEDAASAPNPKRLKQTVPTRSMSASAPKRSKSVSKRSKSVSKRSKSVSAPKRLKQAVSKASK